MRPLIIILEIDAGSWKLALRLGARSGTEVCREGDKGQGGTRVGLNI
jgi:hypothetical protein